MTRTPTDLIQRGVSRVVELLGARAGDVWRRLFGLLQGVRGLEVTLRAIASAESEADLRDHLAEAEYFLLFVHIGCTVAVEPSGAAGPDALVEGRGVSSQVEITRFRKMHDGPPPIDAARRNPQLIEYGDVARDSRKAYQKIVSKLRQLPGQASGLAIWNDDEDMEEYEVSIAVEMLRTESAEGRLTLPAGLQFIVYASRWRGQKQFHFFSLVADHPWKEPIERTFRSEWLG